MRILQVISSFPPAYSYGGPVKVAYEISKELAKRGHEVTVYTTDVYDSDSRLKYNKNPALMDGIEVHRFKNISNKLAHKNLAAAPTIAFALNKNIRNFDIVHLHEYRSFQAILVHYYAKKYGVPYILQPRGSISRIGKGRQKKLFDVLFGRVIVEDASKIIATSRIESDQYWNVFPDLKNKKIVHIPNGIDLESYQNLPERGGFRKKYGIRGDEKIILYLGRIHKIKGIGLLVRAFADLTKRLNNVKLVIVGPDDGFLSTLKKQIEDLKIGDKVLFTGPLYEKDKLEAYVDADAYVLPSSYESFGNVVLEAMTCGTPVVVTDHCGIANFVNKVGYVVEYDKDQLRNAIIKILSNDELRRRFGEEGRRLVKEYFSWDKIIEGIEKIHKDITNR